MATVIGCLSEFAAANQTSDQSVGQIDGRRRCEQFATPSRGLKIDLRFAVDSYSIECPFQIILFISKVRYLGGE